MHYIIHYLWCTNVWTKDTEEFECDIFHHFFDFDSFSATEGLWFMTALSQDLWKGRSMHIKLHND